MLFLCTTTATDSNWTRMFVVCDSHLQLSWSCWSWHDRTTVNTVSLAVSLFLLVTVQRRLSFWCLANLQPENEFYTGHTKIGSTGLDQCLVSAELRYQKERKSDQVWLTWGLAKTLYHCLTAHVSSDFLVMSPCSQISEMNVLTVMLPIEIMTKTDIQVVKTKQNKTGTALWYFSNHTSGNREWQRKQCKWWQGGERWNRKRADKPTACDNSRAHTPIVTVANKDYHAESLWLPDSQDCRCCHFLNRLRNLSLKKSKKRKGSMMLSRPEGYTLHLLMTLWV